MTEAQTWSHDRMHASPLGHRLFAEAAAQALGAASLHQVYQESPSAPAMAEASTEALAISPTPEGLADFKADGRWRKLERTEVRPWTDDYVNLFGALIRSMQSRAG